MDVLTPYLCYVGFLYKSSIKAHYEGVRCPLQSYIVLIQLGIGGVLSATSAVSSI